MQSEFVVPGICKNRQRQIERQTGHNIPITYFPAGGRNNKPATSPYTMSYVTSARGITAENMEKSRRYD